MPMFALIVIALSALAPICWASWQSYRWRLLYTDELHNIMQQRSLYRVSATQRPPEFRYIEGVGYMIGDLSCRYNARSPLLRCAINPTGPCKGCHTYEPLADESTEPYW